jgi:phosphate transport system permease protein
VGIVASLLWESLRFFSFVNPFDFLFGTKWSPQSAALGYGSDNAFGAVPLFWGTIFIGAIIAMVVAIPLGLMSAIYLTQYAKPRARAWLKPILEVLAGVPTVVYGYFAALTIAPNMRDFAVMLGIPTPRPKARWPPGW